MRKLLSLLLTLCALPVLAADSYIKFTLTVTNVPITSNTIAINGNLRTWTNATTASTILTNAVGVGPAATNLFNALAIYPERAVIVTYLSTNSFSVECTNLSLTLGGNWASITSGTTNALGSSYALMYPVDRLSATNRTNNMSDVARGISLYSTQALNGVIITNARAISGTVGVLTNGNYKTPILESPLQTNGYSTNAVLDSPTTTNLVNQGNAISSPGSALNSEQFGTGALATNVSATAIGKEALAGGDASVALGNGTEAYDVGGTAIGTGAGAAGGQSTAIGSGAVANATNAMALGTFSSSSFANSTAIGAFVSSTDSNQIRIGRSSDTVSIPGRIEAGTITNATLTGTNQLLGDLASPMASVTSLANGNNLAVPLTNLFVAVSGPSAAFSINGIYGGRSGRWLRLLNRSGQTMTLAHESGVDPTPANRILCAPANDQSYSDGEFVDLWYDGSSSRWRTSVHNTNLVTVALTNALGTLRTNAVAVTTALTNLNILPGTNINVRATNVNGTVDLEINGPTIPTIPTAFAYDRQFSTNGGTITITNGAQVTNLFLKPLSASTPALTTTNASGQTASIVEHRESNGALIGGVTNGIGFMNVSNAHVIYPACYRVFTQTAESQVTNITTTATSLFGTGVGSLVLTNNFWQVGRTLEVKIRGTLFTTASPISTYFSIRCGSTELATNIYAIGASLSGQIFELSATVTCRTNSGTIGYVEAQGVFNSASTGDAYRFNLIKGAGPLFDTTAPSLFDVVVTNGASTTGFRTKTATVTLYP